MSGNGNQPGDAQAPASPAGQGERAAARRPISRRVFLRVSAATGLSAGVAASCVPPDGADRGAVPQVRLGPELGAVPTPAPPPDTLMHFTQDQAAIVRAASGRIIPDDENGPGAIEAGVLYFIDRQLASDGFFGGRVYRQGPFETGAPTQGDQSRLSMQDRYRLGLAAMEEYARRQLGRGFADLTEAEQDQILADMDGGRADQAVTVVGIESVPVEFAGTTPETVQHASPAGKVFGLQAFFETLRSHTIAGFFCDPIHGGNREMVGWKLIGFPGAQIGGYRDWILNYGVPFTGGFAGLADYHRQSALGPQSGHAAHGGGR